MLRYLMLCGWLLTAVATVAPCHGESRANPTAQILTSVLPGRTWVPASTALDSKGNLRGSVASLVGQDAYRPNNSRHISETERSALERGKIKADALACPPNEILIDTDWDSMVVASSLEGLVNAADESLVLRVHQVEPGFMGGLPQSLLRATVSTVLHSESAIVAGQEVLVVYRHAEFLVGETLWCHIDPRFNLRPAPGDRLLIFSSAQPQYLDPNRVRLFVPYPHEVVLGSGDDRIGWPRDLSQHGPSRSAHLKSFAELVDVLRKLASSRGEK